ncbi:IS1096 element passenger TnpR family protein [Flagellimonas zhangzhouensis]
MNWKDPPKISREFLAPANTKLYRLHHIIPIVMGWENHHHYKITIFNY